MKKDERKQNSCSSFLLRKSVRLNSDSNNCCHSGRKKETFKMDLETPGGPHHDVDGGNSDVDTSEEVCVSLGRELFVGMLL